MMTLVTWPALKCPPLVSGHHFIFILLIQNFKQIFLALMRTGGWDCGGALLVLGVFQGKKVESHFSNSPWNTVCLTDLIYIKILHL